VEGRAEPGRGTGELKTSAADLTDGDLIRRIAALRRARTSMPMRYTRHSGEITLMLAELMARGIELDEEGNRRFTVVEPRPSKTVLPSRAER